MRQTYMLTTETHYNPNNTSAKL